MKKVILLLVALLFMTYVSALSYNINTFSNGLQAENITITGNEDVIRYLNVPIWGTVNNSNITITGYDFFAVDLYNQSINKTPVTLRLNATGAGYVVPAPGDDSVFYLNNITRNADNLYIAFFPEVGEWLRARKDFNIFFHNATFEAWFYDNGTLNTADESITFFVQENTAITGGIMMRAIGSTTNFTWYNLDDDTYHVSGFQNYNGWKKLTMYVNDTNARQIQYYVNNTLIGIANATGNIDTIRFSNYRDGTPTVPMRVGEVMVYNGTPRSGGPLLNPYVEVGTQDGIHEWNYSGIYGINDTFTEDIILNKSLFNSILDAGCICTGCNITGTYCSIPYTFNAEKDAVLEYSHINLDLLLTIILIDEVDNTEFDLNQTTSARVYWDENRSYFDFKNANVTTYNSTNVTQDKLRFEFKYSDGTIITRWIDTTLIDGTNLRVCVNKEGVTHYEQLIISASQKRVVLKNLFSDCLIAADYTRFAYQDAYLLKAYTIDSLYYLYTYDEGQQVYLASVDGSVSAYINVDTLEFQQEGYNIDILSEALSFQKTDNTTIQIYYNNLKEDNTALDLAITRMDTSTEVFTTSDFTDPNEFTLYFNFATLDVNESTLFLLELDKTTADGTTTLRRYFNTGASTGVISSGFALVISILSIVFGLTFAAARITFSFFGMFATMAAIGVCALSVAAWYITFLQVINVIILVYIITVMVTKNTATLA